MLPALVCAVCREHLLGQHTGSLKTSRHEHHRQVAEPVLWIQCAVASTAFSTRHTCLQGLQHHNAHPPAAGRPARLAVQAPGVQQKHQAVHQSFWWAPHLLQPGPWEPGHSQLLHGMMQWGILPCAVHGRCMLSTEHTALFTSCRLCVPMLCRHKAMHRQNYNAHDRACLRMYQRCRVLHILLHLH